MNLILSTLTLVSVAIVHAQQGEKGNSIIPFPRVGRGDGNPTGLIPFPRIGRSGPREVKRQLIPFPRVGKRPFWHMEPSYFNEYDDFSPMVDPSNSNLFPGMAFPMEMNSPSDDGDVEKRGQNPNAGGMWFGPRLGRRKKRSVDSSSPLESSSEHRETLDTKTLLKILHNFNWAIVPVKERRNFTPRLGRSSHDPIVHQRAQPFSPRLGRSGEVVSHEVDFDDDYQPTKFRRNDDSSDEHEPPVGPPFSPRLGRAEPFSPRLGRSSDDRK